MLCRQQHWNYSLGLPQESHPQADTSRVPLPAR